MPALKGTKPFLITEVFLKYDSHGNPTMRDLKKMSTSAQRKYVSFRTLVKLKRLTRTFIVSTPKGVMTDQDAISKKLGGELLAVIY